MASPASKWISLARRRKRKRLGCSFSAFPSMLLVGGGEGRGEQRSWLPYNRPQSQEQPGPGNLHRGRYRSTSFSTLVPLPSRTDTMPVIFCTGQRAGFVFGDRARSRIDFARLGDGSKPLCIALLNALREILIVSEWRRSGNEAEVKRSYLVDW